MSAQEISRFDDSAGPEREPERGEIDLWSIDLNPSARQLHELRQLLSTDEIDRAERFRFEVHRRRYIARRGAMRSLLGSYLGVSARELSFTYGERGKPRLEDRFQEMRSAADELHFNLSDSADLAMLAVTRGCEVGVDVEMLREMPDAQSIAKNFFSASEMESLAAVDDAQTATAFFNCWTRKEAYLKAIGEGLAAPLNGFSVNLEPAEPPRFLSFNDRQDEAENWSLFHLVPGPDSVGALALRSRDYRARGFQWRPRG